MNASFFHSFIFIGSCQGFIRGQIVGGNLHIYLYSYMYVHTHVAQRKHVYSMILKATLMQHTYLFFFQNNDGGGAMAKYSDVIRGKYVRGMIVI